MIAKYKYLKCDQPKSQEIYQNSLINNHFNFGGQTSQQSEYVSTEQVQLQSQPTSLKRLCGVPYICYIYYNKNNP